jgi:hypothetical protein
MSRLRTIRQHRAMKAKLALKNVAPKDGKL